MEHSVTIRSLAALLCIAGTAAMGCSSTEPDDGAMGAAGWVGAVTTEGDVTTVVNESGSVWGAPAMLVEEATFGVESGDDAYMFGRISGIWASDEKIYVVDEQKPAVRVYDYEGRHLQDIGAPGEGPGEFRSPAGITGMADGRVFVLEGASRRLNVYAPDGSSQGSWPLAGRIGCCLHPMAATADGAIWVESYEVDRERRLPDPGMQAHRSEGPVGDLVMVPELDYEHWTLQYNSRTIESVPYAPGIVWAIHPAGAIVAAASDQYRFEIRTAGGATTVVERYWEPIPVIDEESQYAASRVRQIYGRTESGQQATLVWDGRVPENKPAFTRFATTPSMVWVIREGPGEPRPDCDPAALEPSPLSGRMMPVRCFTASSIVDAFDLDGRYLGEIRLPGGGGAFIPTTSFVGDETAVVPSQDANGTIVVRRYRLVLPEGAGS